MTRDRVVGLLALLLLLAAGWWLQQQTEWVEVERGRPAQGEARSNPVYALEQLLRRLGMQTARPETLERLPPAGARLLLLSDDWVLKPALPQQLQAWVHGGGHLVLVEDADWRARALASWLPLEVRTVKAPKNATTPQPAVAPDRAEATVAGAQPLLSTPPLWQQTERLSACVGFTRYLNLRPRKDLQPQWSLTQLDAQGREQVPARLAALRVGLGQGSVTALNVGSELLRNPDALRCDHPLLLAAAMQAEPGALLWIYLHEKREPLLPWLWQQAWVAIAIGLLALAALLWRISVRFGPRRAAAPRLRRSIAEQVQGLADYLRQGSPEALLAAQQRALNEAADRHLRGYTALAVAERARAIASATGLPAHELAVALSTRFCTRAALPGQLQLLELARRRLHRNPSKEPPR